MHIEIRDTAEGAAMAFPFHREMISAVKATFPKARWDSSQKVWSVPGKTARRRCEAWAAERAAAAQAARDIEVAARAAVPADAIVSRRVVRQQSGWLVTVPYDETSVSELRGIPGADGKSYVMSWWVPIRSTDALRNILIGLERRADEADARHAARDAEAATEREARRVSDAAARQARDDEMRARRMLVRSRSVSVGTVTRRGAEAVVVTDLGKVFRVDDENTSAYGLMPGEDYWMQYAYVRLATPAETAALVAREAAEAEAAAIEAAHVTVVREASRRLREIADEVRRDGDRPLVGQVIGEDLLPHRYQRFRGLRLADNGSLWLLQDNGADGDNWANSNAGGDIGWRLVGDRVPALVTEIRALVSRGGDL